MVDRLIILVFTILEMTQALRDSFCNIAVTLDMCIFPQHSLPVPMELSNTGQDSSWQSVIMGLAYIMYAFMALSSTLLRTTALPKRMVLC